MKRIVPIAAAMAIATTIGVTSCKQETTTEPSNTIEFTALTGSATFKLLNSAADYNRDSDLVYFDSAAIVLPTAIYNQDITALQDTIIAAAFDTLNVDHSAAMHSAFVAAASEAGYALDTIPTNADQRFNSDGNTIISGDIFSLTPHLLTYRISKEVYLPGAAHGMTINHYLTYNIDEACLMPLSYIFTPEGINELPAIIASRAKDMANQIGKTDIKALPANDNYYIDLNGTIVFVYEPYEAASFAQGELAIPFYPFQLSELMTAEGRDLFHLESEEPAN